MRVAAECRKLSVTVIDDLSWAVAVPVRARVESAHHVSRSEVRAQEFEVFAGLDFPFGRNSELAGDAI
jgi:hypothetical protein